MGGYKTFFVDFLPQMEGNKTLVTAMSWKVGLWRKNSIFKLVITKNFISGLNHIRARRLKIPVNRSNLKISAKLKILFDQNFSGYVDRININGYLNLCLYVFDDVGKSFFRRFIT